MSAQDPVIFRIDQDIQNLSCHAHLVRLDQLSPSVEGLPPEYPAKGAVVPSPDLSDNLVHGPTIQILVADHLMA